jgi:hypothetical protein
MKGSRRVHGKIVEEWDAPPKAKRRNAAATMGA